VEVVRVLLQGGADVQRENGYTYIDYYNYTALHKASYYGHLEVCRLLLDWGAKVNAEDSYKATALHDAASGGRLSVAKL
jgi:ankyrin repeat protein